MIPRLYGLIALLAVMAGAWLYLSGRKTGAELCETRHQQAQTKLNEKVRKSDAKRDNEKPRSADRDKLLEWLRQYGSE